MEYVDGISIDQYNPMPWSKRGWKNIFTEVIDAFKYLETNHILHRDIRPANILIDREDNVKIIDFGFGKQLDGSRTDGNSILLNWPATEMPNEVQLNQEYDERTEIYFVGTFFRHLLRCILISKLRVCKIIITESKIGCEIGFAAVKPTEIVSGLVA